MPSEQVGAVSRSRPRRGGTKRKCRGALGQDHPRAPVSQGAEDAISGQHALPHRFSCTEDALAEVRLHGCAQYPLGKIKLPYQSDEFVQTTIVKLLQVEEQADRWLSIECGYLLTESPPQAFLGWSVSLHCVDPQAMIGVIPNALPFGNEP